MKERGDGPTQTAAGAKFQAETFKRTQRQVGVLRWIVDRQGYQCD
ncbi:MAG TPA: hypothetical protein VFW11_00825 [Cyclobacteriaceae bacterium]|nr:hypothetical protein [Cyclobacteriaceae bacterium]